MRKITPFEARILGASGLALSGFVGMTVLNNGDPNVIVNNGDTNVIIRTREL